MSGFAWPNQAWSQKALAAAVLLASVAPAWGCSERTASTWDWEHCWSVQRWALLLLALVLLWLVCFHVLFPAFLAPGVTAKEKKTHRALAPRPRTAFGRSLALFLFSAAVAFVFLFGWVEDELRRTPASLFPASLDWLNVHWRWLLVLLLGLALALLSLFAYRPAQVETRA